ncbi:helix-turn-helix transcriptional regulator [Shewanella sp. 202IG2-18]|uniref:helix-turn-helix domain-containing protein n=1 Tax=Parashewanella hymeniacidonis TaxID=2807618 RepID=UPI0019618756|nr:helix-turn-helix transcriptional regulator [Parashewanella hymeniacidonis]MBM7074430.1 helix-turn-helix transcriptional regulator [Parashewanella hymeniacidonis]
MAKRVTLFPKPDPSSSVDAQWLGALIRHKRTSVKMTLEDAAGLCGLSKQAYNNVELGVENSRVESLFKALNGMGIKLSVIETVEITDDWGNFDG